MISPGITRRGFLQGLAALAGMAVVPITVETGEVFAEVTVLPAKLAEPEITESNPFAWLEMDGQRYRVGMAELHVEPADRGGWSMQMVMLDYPKLYESFFFSRGVAPIRLQVPGFDGCFEGRGRIYSMTQFMDAAAIRTEIEIEGLGDLHYV